MLGLGWRALALQGQSMLQEAIKKSWSCVGREYSCDIDNWGWQCIVSSLPFFSSMQLGQDCECRGAVG